VKQSELLHYLSVSNVITSGSERSWDWNASFHEQTFPGANVSGNQTMHRGRVDSKFDSCLIDTGLHPAEADRCIAAVD